MILDCIDIGFMDGSYYASWDRTDSRRRVERLFMIEVAEEQREHRVQPVFPGLALLTCIKPQSREHVQTVDKFS